MNDIKFRAWDKTQNEMFDFDIYNVPHYVGQTYLEGEKFERNHEIMQYTGLKDKNGVKIYEGDVLSYFGGKYPTVFRKSAFGWIEDGSFYAFAEMAITEMSKAEIIGNIYENPELLGDN